MVHTNRSGLVLLLFPRIYFHAVSLVSAGLVWWRGRCDGWNRNPFRRKEQDPLIKNSLLDFGILR